MTSPLSRLSKNKKVAELATATQPAVGPLVERSDQLPAAPAASPLKKVTSKNTSYDIRQQFLMPITSDDLEELGSDISKNIGVTTDKITRKFSTASFGELGDILYNVQTQANALSTDDLMSGGIIGWIRRKGADVKAVLMKRMQSASDAFDTLEGKMTDQRTVLETWEDDLEALYKENYDNYLRLKATLDQATNIRNTIKQRLDNLPIIEADDPDAFMKAQLLEQAKGLLNDAEIKIDTLKRQIIICEHHGPNIQNKIRMSQSQKRMLTRMINEVIPMVKLEFTMFLQNLEMQKSIQLVDSARDMSDQAFKLSADSSRDAAIAAAKSANTALISTDTLNHIRTRMLETVQSVQQIQSDAQKQREEDSKQLDQSQAEYLKELQLHKVI